jgi:hypothetical protein
MHDVLAGSEPDRRTAWRYHIRLLGRYMLFDRSEWSCKTVDISPNGVRLSGMARPYIGQTVVVYLDELGRLEGSVARIQEMEFALHFRMTERKRELLATSLAMLAEGESAPRRLYPALATKVLRYSEAPIPPSVSAPVHTTIPLSSNAGTADRAFRVYLDAL